MTRYDIGGVGQWAACVMVTFGIIIEVLYGADIGYLMITTGSLILALATKIKYYRKRSHGPG